MVSLVPRGPVAIRDESGLDLTQRRLLSEIVLTGSWQQAADNCGLDRRAVRRMFKDAAFKAEYDALFDPDEVKTTERELNLVADDVASILEQAKDAELTKTVNTTCPNCKHKFSLIVKVMDMANKIRAAEILMKYRGQLRDQRSVKVEGNVNVQHVHWSFRDVMVMEKLRLGLPVPEQAYREVLAKAEQAGVALPAPVDGEYREIANHPDE